MRADNLSVRLIAMPMAASLALAQPQEEGPPAPAAEVGSWKHLDAIKPESDIRAKRTGVKKPVRAEFVSAGPDAIQFNLAGADRW